MIDCRLDSNMTVKGNQDAMSDALGTTIIQAAFDYARLDTETRIVVQQRTEEIRVLVRRSAQDIIDIGTKLIEIKARLGHGNFGTWLDAEFGWNWKTATSLMNVATKFVNFTNLNQFAPSALYLLAAPSTPEDARSEAMERADAGETITHAVAQTIVREYRTENAPPSIEIPFRYAVTPTNSYATPCAPEQPPSVDETNEVEEEYHYTVTDEFGHQEVITIGDDEEIAVVKSAPHVSHNSGNNEWYTPAEYIDAARTVMGGIDLDPASSDTANATVRAARYYTAENDGLLNPWAGRVWLNPPYASELIGKFAERLVFHLSTEDVVEAIVLVNNATETAWFATLASCAAAVVFPRGRVRFWQPTGELGAPLQGQAVLYFGKNENGFLGEFKSFGWGAAL